MFAQSSSMVHKKEEIKAVIFDINGVLQLGNGYSHERDGSIEGVHNYIANKLKMSMDHYFDALDTSYALSIEGKISRKKAIQTIAKNLKISQEKLRGLFKKAYRRKFKKNKKLLKFASKLKKKGYKTAILSDQWHLSEEFLSPKKLTNRFDHVVLSTTAKVRKPNPKIYRMILKKLKLPAKNTVFIDDRNWNITPAKKLGMNTILFKDNKQTIQDLEKLGVK